MYLYIGKIHKGEIYTGNARVVKLSLIEPITGQLNDHTIYYS